MTFINILKERLKEKKNKINVKAPISSMPGADWAELNITSLDESPVMLGTPTDNLKFRFQPLLSGSRCIPCPYRLDNCHGSLHQHFGDSESPITFPTLSGALIHVLGSEFEVLNEK